MSANIGVCPKCDKEKKLVKSGLCLGCNNRMRAAEKKAKAAETPAAVETPVEETAATEPTAKAAPIQRDRARRVERVSLEDRMILGKSKEDEDPEFVHRIANHDPDKPGRIEELEREGWDVVENRGGPSRPLSELTGDAEAMGTAETKPVGGGITGVYMQKRRDWHEQDMATLAKHNQKKEDDIFGDAAKAEYKKQGLIRKE